jgi:hypothetical protein
MRLWPLALAVFLLGPAARAEKVTSISQYGVTWTFDQPYESGKFATGDHWVVGPVKVVSVSPAPTGTRHGSALNPKGGRQAYDSRGGGFDATDAVTFPTTLSATSSLVSSVSKPEGSDPKNVGPMVSQAVLTVVAGPLPPTALRPSYAGTFKQQLDQKQIDWSLLPKLPPPSSKPNGAKLLQMADRPRIDHLSSWTIQHSCAEENWFNGDGAHACYGREVAAYVSSAALYILLDTPEREELTLSMIQHGIDNYGVLKAGGTWEANGGHHNARKWPIVLAGRLLGDCDLLKVGLDYGDAQFGEDGHTYVGKSGKALFGQACGSNQTYFQNGCSGSGAKDCRDPAELVDGCGDYRNCCTSAYWVGEMLSTLMLRSKKIWAHDALLRLRGPLDERRRDRRRRSVERVRRRHVEGPSPEAAHRRRRRAHVYPRQRRQRRRIGRGGGRQRGRWSGERRRWGQQRREHGRRSQRRRLRHRRRERIQRGRRRLRMSKRVAKWIAGCARRPGGRGSGPGAGSTEARYPSVKPV